jgi:hypothetical protein
MTADVLLNLKETFISRFTVPLSHFVVYMTNGVSSSFAFACLASSRIHDVDLICVGYLFLFHTMVMFGIKSQTGSALLTKCLSLFRACMFASKCTLTHIATARDNGRRTPDPRDDT